MESDLAKRALAEFLFNTDDVSVIEEYCAFSDSIPGASYTNAGLYCAYVFNLDHLGMSSLFYRVLESSRSGTLNSVDFDIIETHIVDYVLDSFGVLITSPRNKNLYRLDPY